MRKGTSSRFVNCVTGERIFGSLCLASADLPADLVCLLTLEVSAIKAPHQGARAGLILFLKSDFANSCAHQEIADS
jgi:hypothetical protein